MPENFGSTGGSGIANIKVRKQVEIGANETGSNENDESIALSTQNGEAPDPDIDSIINCLEHYVSDDSDKKIPNHYKSGDHYDKQGNFHRETESEKKQK